MIVLDTCIFLRMNLQPEKLSRAVVKAIEAESSLGLPVISLWEIAMLVQYQRLSIPDPSLREWFQVVLPAPKLRLLPLTPEIASRSGTLEMHGDPADRLIAATALEHGCRLATTDEKLTELSWLNIIS
jgi:PIN domain nuclease of toxin-antitoxin system